MGYTILDIALASFPLALEAVLDILSSKPGPSDSYLRQRTWGSDVMSIPDAKMQKHSDMHRVLPYLLRVSTFTDTRFCFLSSLS